MSKIDSRQSDVMASMQANMASSRPRPRPNMGRSPSSFERVVSAFVADTDNLVNRETCRAERAWVQGPGRTPVNSPARKVVVQTPQEQADAALPKKKSWWQRFRIASNRYLCSGD